MLKTIQKKSSIALAALFLCAAPLGAARASTLAFSVPEAAATYTQFGNDGFTFTPTTNITVTALDYYLSPYTPENGAALIDPHQVGIYAVSNPSTPLVQTTIGPGTGSGIVGGPGPTDSFFVSQSVTPIELFAGQQYMLAGYSQPNENENGGNPSGVGIPFGSLLTAPGVTLNAYYYDYSGGLDYPTTPYATAFVGPDFQFTATPEPATLTLLASGFLAAGAFYFGRRRRAAALSPAR
jgi:hypothetical protein